MAAIKVFVHTRRPHRSHGYYCAICPFSSGGNIIQKKKKKKKKKNPTQIMTCARPMAWAQVINNLAMTDINISCNVGYSLFGFKNFEHDDIQALNRISLKKVESSLVGTVCQELTRKLYSGTFVAKVKFL